jgi:glycosyltransferase involved in cell wall biosynthesis
VKIVVVSAHYPPNFVSGGTLVPQRTARLLADRGHDVKVYAGWLGDIRPPLEAWDEVDEGGLPVRWIVSTPWMSWSDTGNYDNAAVSADFDAYLSRERPDLVHFHSLQTIGVGLVEAATRRHIPTVVTMHDFWWWCSRQFLCDLDYKPCSLVVEAGACECHAGRSWSDARRARTEAVLDRVDAVIAVSEVAGRVMRANGVDPRRMRVVENGVVEALPGEIRRRDVPGTLLRFTFTGGDNPMKGLPILLDAVQTMKGQPGWKLTCYGCEGVESPIDQVDVRPSFDPDRLGDILAETDVLVVPSVMRETYSLITREALGAGIPVVTSDSLGPEEVVRDGVNGLVVPSADVEALADAMNRLVADPVLVERLQVGSAGGTGTATLEAQVGALEGLYGELMSASARGAQIEAEVDLAPRRQVRRVLFVVGIEGAPLRYRARLPAEALEALGVHTDVRHYRHPDISRLGDEADAVVVYRVPATFQINHFIAGVQRRGTPVLFDVDDLIFDPEIRAEIPALKILPPDEAALWLEGIMRYRTTMEQCDGFIGSTEMLCRQAEAVTGLPAYRFPNGVGDLLARLSDEALRRPRTPGPLRIGYLSGTNTHDHDWRYVEPAVGAVLARHLEAELWLVGLVEPTDALDRYADRIRRFPLLSWHELPGMLRDIDVNLAPLEPSSRFNEAKSAIKWLEAALTATPTVASPTEPFREAVEDGVSGLLALDGTAWRDSLEALLSDDLLRRGIGVRARREALLDYTSKLQGRRYLDVLERAAAGARTTIWVPVALDEPFMPIDLEAYERPLVVGTTSTVERAEMFAPVEVIEVGPQVADLPGSTVVVKSRAERLSRALVRSLRQDGLEVTAGRIARRAMRKAAEFGGWAG